MLWTVLSTREYAPEVLKAFDDAKPLPATKTDAKRAVSKGLIWLLVGLVGVAVIFVMSLDKQLYLLTGGIAAYGLLLSVTARGYGPKMLREIIDDLQQMPDEMRKLAVVQFFSWFALFAMWIYTTAAVTEIHFGSTDTSSAAYNEGANWVGVLFGAYNGFAAIAAIIIPFLVRWFGLRFSHMLNVSLGGAALLSFALIRDPNWLLLSMVGVGFAWASILSLPYSLLSNSVPAQKMGVYMGIFNFFIVIPQMMAASTLGFLLKTFFDTKPIYALVIGGVSLILSGLFVLRVREPKSNHSPQSVTGNGEASCA